MSHNARRAAAEQFKWEKIAEQTISVYRQTIS
jgi:glycosyltransferase involved in cell wall biosynthesis